MSHSIPIVRYHHISPEPGLFTVSPGHFTAQMQAIHDAGFRTMNTEDLLDCLWGKRCPPEKSVLITFDEGYLDNYIYAWPVLRRLQMKASFFLTTGEIGQGAVRAQDPSSLADQCNHYQCRQAIKRGRADQVMLRWEELNSMADSGHIEIHSRAHLPQRWFDLDLSTDQRSQILEQDLAQSRGLILRQTGQIDRHLAWPDPPQGGDPTPEQRDIARKVGFLYQYGSEPGPNLRGTHPDGLSRFDAEDRSGDWLVGQLKRYRSWLRSTLHSRLFNP